jgi:hypothetical protein
MTEEVSEAPKARWPESMAELVHTGDWYGAPDPRLQWMSDFADTANAGIGITLVVSGGVISGTVVSGEEFFKITAEAFRKDTCDDDGNPNSTAEALAESFFDFPAEQIAKDVKEIGEAFDKGERDEPRWPSVRYVHLKDARFSVPGQSVNFPLGYTRILLSQVVGWTCGQRWVSDPA